MAQRAEIEFEGSQTFATDAYRRRCSMMAAGPTVVDTGVDIPVRAAPDATAVEVSTVLPGAWLGYAPSRAKVGLAGRSDETRCSALCRNASFVENGSADWNALQACFEADVFWYPFDHPEGTGQTVWVNGKYLRY